MRYRYLLVAWFVLARFTARSQAEVYYASRTNMGSYTDGHKNPLKQCLHELDRSFGVSIAYKDVWVVGQTAHRDISKCKTVEDARSGLFPGTRLYFEKDGEPFYDIYQRNATTPAKPAQQSPTRILPPFYTASTSGPVISPPEETTYMHKD